MTKMNLKSPDFLVAKVARRKEISIFFAPLLFCGLVSRVAYGQSADEILNSVRQSESKVQLRATQIVQRGNSREVARLERSGNRRRLEWSAPGVKAGDLLVDDGQTVTVFHRADKTAIQTQSPRRAGLLSAGNWSVSAPKQMDGRTVRVLSRNDGREITFDTKTYTILRSKTPSGVTTLQNVEYVQVPASTFQFSAPAGVKVVRTQGRLFADLSAAKRFSTWLQVPAQLPRGYAFESAIAGKDEVWLRFSDGKKRLSLFQQKTNDGDLAPRKVGGGWFWRKNGLRYVATGASDEAINLLAR